MIGGHNSLSAQPGAPIEDQDDSTRAGITLIECLVVVAIIVVLIALLLPPVQSGGPPPQFCPPRRLTQRWPLRLSGRYDRSRGTFAPDSLETLDILLDGRYMRTFIGRHGLTGVSNYATGTAERLVLERGEPSDHRPPLTYHVIRWGSRDYLVEADRLAEFCTAIENGSEPRTKAAGKFYLRRGDWNKPVEGIPTLPDPWKARIQSQLARGPKPPSSGNMLPE